jgi:hypothetical protein
MRHDEKCTAGHVSDWPRGGAFRLVWPADCIRLAGGMSARTLRQSERSQGRGLIRRLAVAANPNGAAYAAALNRVSFGSFAGGSDSRGRGYVTTIGQPDGQPGARVAGQLGAGGGSVIRSGGSWGNRNAHDLGIIRGYWRKKRPFRTPIFRRYQVMFRFA